MILEAHISALRLVGVARFWVGPNVAVTCVRIRPLIDRLPFEENSAVVRRILEVLPCHGGHIFHNLRRVEQEIDGLLD